MKNKRVEAHVLNRSRLQMYYSSTGEPLFSCSVCLPFRLYFLSYSSGAVIISTCLPAETTRHIMFPHSVGPDWLAARPWSFRLADCENMANHEGVRNRTVCSGMEGTELLSTRAVQ